MLLSTQQLKNLFLVNLKCFPEMRPFSLSPPFYAELGTVCLAY